MNKYMELALDQAKKANQKNEVPVGAVIVRNNKVIAKAFNLRELKDNVLGHAEIIAIIKAQKKLKDWRLYDCDMYVTLKPCDLCEKVILESRLGNIYYLSEKKDIKKKYQNTVITKLKNIDSSVEIEYSKMLSTFFANKR